MTKRTRKQVEREILEWMAWWRSEGGQAVPMSALVGDDDATLADLVEYWEHVKDMPE